jgi:hypothetical protein
MTAFQPSAFQYTAFQIIGGAPQVVTPTGNAAGGKQQTKLTVRGTPLYDQIELLALKDQKRRRDERILMDFVVSFTVAHYDC